MGQPKGKKGGTTLFVRRSACSTVAYCCLTDVSTRRSSRFLFGLGECFKTKANIIIDGSVNNSESIDRLMNEKKVQFYSAVKTCMPRISTLNFVLEHTWGCVSASEGQRCVQASAVSRKNGRCSEFSLSVCSEGSRECDQKSRKSGHKIFQKN